MRVVQVSLSDLQMPQQKPAAKEAVKTTIKFTPPEVDQRKDTTKKSTVKFTPPIILPDNANFLDEIVVVGYGSPEPVISENGKPLPRLENKKAEFPGGYNAMLKFLHDKIQYPYEAQKNNVTGTVFIQFEVNESGEAVNPKILRGVTKSLDEEGLRLVQSMPKWSPAIKDSNPVSSIYCIPIKFMLQKN